MQATRTPQQGELLPQTFDPAQGGLLGIIRRCRSLVHDGRLEEASALIIPAIRHHPNEPWLFALHGKVLLQLGRPGPAIGALTLAAELDPEQVETLSDLVLAHLELGQAEQALPVAIAAFGLVQDGGRSVNLSCVLLNLGAYAEALGFADHALGLRADHSEALGNRALALEGLCRYDEAIMAARLAVAIAPDNPVIRHNCAVILLATGHLTSEAWDHYEARLKLKRHQLNWPATLVRWNGEDLHGRTILLQAEQGFGDTIQFARYAPLVAARGGRVILVVQAALFRLMRNTPGVDQLVANGDPLPKFDVYCPLMSLPGIFGTTLSTIPPVMPYPDCPGKDAVEPLFGSAGFRVGLVWAGNRDFVDDRRRSLHPAALVALAGIPGVRFYGLQLGAAETPQTGLEITDLMRGVQDFADTAARIAGLDLVIAADTAIAHLAATMGKPVWLLSRYCGCWRWLQDRSDSPWYLTLQIYRQTRPNSWEEILGIVRRDLTVLAQNTVLRGPQPRQRSSALGPVRACKVCGTPAQLFGSVDFHKGCEDRRSGALAPSGRDVTYHRCPQCALIFTGAFDKWDREAFRRHVYNDGYAAVDPDYAHERPAGSAKLLRTLFGDPCLRLGMLDYGGGNGTLAGLLTAQHGGSVEVYDPFNPQCDVIPARTYRMITSFEVLEHCTDPVAAVAQIAGLLDPEGIVVFTTLLQPGDIMRQGLGWWYAAPRNGHVTLYSAEAIRRLWVQAGFGMRSFNNNLHVAFRAGSRFASDDAEPGDLLSRVKRWTEKLLAK